MIGDPLVSQPNDSWYDYAERIALVVRQLRDDVEGLRTDVDGLMEEKPT